MKNEKDISAGHGTATRKRKTAKAASGIGRMGNRTQPPERSKGDRPQHTATRPARPFANGFLRQQFLPMYAPIPHTPENKGIDEGVFNSLAILSEKLAVRLPETKHLGYPYNILLAQHETEKVLRRKYPELDLFIMDSETGDFSLATMETAMRSYDLYYIPVRPLFKLLRSRQNKTAKKSLLAVFSYLYHVAKVPGHRDEETFLHYHIEMVKDWIEEDPWEDEDQQPLLNDIRQANYEGDYVQQRYWNKYHLEHFAETVANAKPKTKLDRQCLQLAADYLKLWQDYPQGSIYQHLRTEDGKTENEEDGDDYGNTIYVQEYIHLIHDVNGLLYENIYSNIQSEFAEKPHMQQHSLMTIYDRNTLLKGESLGYMTRFYELADQLCDLLMNELK